MLLGDSIEFTVAPENCLLRAKSLPFGMTFELRQLNAFLAIVEAGSLGRAAEALHITQPALSRTVKRLEELVGTEISERHSTGMQLTATGQALLPRAELLQREAAQTMEEMHALRGVAKGAIRVGAVGSIASLVLPQAISAVLEKWPNLKVTIVEGVWDRLAQALLQREIDLALGMAGAGTDDIDEIRDCRWQDKSYVVAAMSHPLRGRRGLCLADTLEQKWATLPHGTAPHEQMRQVFLAQGLGLPNVVVETRSIIALKSLVAQSGFLSWMADSIYDAERRAHWIDALDIPGAVSARTLTAFKRRQGVLPAPAAKLLDELRLLTSPLGS